LHDLQTLQAVRQLDSPRVPPLTLRPALTTWQLADRCRAKLARWHAGMLAC